MRGGYTYHRFGRGKRVQQGIPRHRQNNGCAFFSESGVEAPSDFENLNVEDLEMSVNPETELTILGEICLNKDRIVSQAEEYGHSVKREYAFLIAHSMLHLLGYDHMEEDEAKVMEEKQAAYLENLGIKR